MLTVVRNEKFECHMPYLLQMLSELMEVTCGYAWQHVQALVRY